MYRENGKLEPIYDDCEMEQIAFQICTGNDSLRLKKVDELIEAQKEKSLVIPKNVVKMCVGVASLFQPWVGVAAGAVESGVSLDSSKIRGRQKTHLVI